MVEGRNDPPPAVSVVVPTLDEAARLPALLSRLRRENPPPEVIVADGASSDETDAVARAGGARVLQAPRGRGPQLRAGAEAAHGAVLLFLHADCVFPAGGIAALLRALEDSPGALGGNFRLLFDGGTAFDRWLTGAYAWARRNGFYYGDSGIFVRAEIYRRLGGIRPVALMEDYDFVRRMERAGPTLCVDEPPLVTSSRRFAGRSAPAIVWGWIEIHLLYWLGVAPERLAKRYDSERRCRRRGAPTREVRP